MSFLDIANEIKKIIAVHKQIEEFFIINNTLGKNIILLIGDENVAETLKESLKLKYGDYIEEIYITKKEDENNYFFNQIKKIGINGEIVHRNLSYKFWMRDMKIQIIMVLQ